MVYICINFIVIYSQIDIEVVAWFYFYICNGWSGRGKCADKSERVIINWKFVANLNKRLYNLRYCKIAVYNYTYWFIWVLRSRCDPFVFLYCIISSWFALKQPSKNDRTLSSPVWHSLQMAFGSSSSSDICQRK